MPNITFLPLAIILTANFLIYNCKKTPSDEQFQVKSSKIIAKDDPRGYCYEELGSYEGVPIYSNGSEAGKGTNCLNVLDNKELKYEYCRLKNLDNVQVECTYGPQCKDFVMRYLAKKANIPHISCHARYCLDQFAKNSELKAYFLRCRDDNHCPKNSSGPGANSCRQVQASPGEMEMIESCEFISGANQNKQNFLSASGMEIWTDEVGIREGDIAIFDDYKWGHIAVIAAVQGDTITLAEQNITSKNAFRNIRYTKTKNSFYTGTSATLIGLVRICPGGNCPAGDPIPDSNADSDVDTDTDAVEAAPNSDAIFELVSDDVQYDWKQLCEDMLTYDNVNTCGLSYSKMQLPENYLVNCKMQEMHECLYGCLVSDDGEDDVCATGNLFRILSLEEVLEGSKTDSPQFYEDKTIADMQDELNTLCNQTLIVNGSSINTCRKGFSEGFAGGKFLPSKSENSPTNKWLIKCQPDGDDHTWVECRQRCKAMPYGTHDICE